MAGFDLAEDQDAVFEELVATAKKEHVDAIIIAGDLYDRANPSEESVKRVNQMLFRLNRQEGFPLLVVSGNHDSGVRLGTGQEWYAATQLYMRTTLKDAFSPIVIDDTQFFLLPYFEPYEAREVLGDPSLTNVNKAMQRISKEMVQQFDPTKKHILVGHFFAAGSAHSDSETLVNVGGLDAVAVSDLQPFDYVALGHLHNRHALDDAKVQYAGSLLKFSVSEAAQEKGVYIIDTATMQRRFVSLAPLHDLQHLTGSFADFADPTNFSEAEKEAYTALTLTDVEVIPNVMAKLRQVFPRLIGLDRKRHVDLGKVVQTNVKLAPTQLLGEFFSQVTGAELSEQQLTWAKAALTKAKGED
ncbi:DNA repair exonuclease [Lacticaseibacillus camelliae DSM 22697 = JCM 13995]|uniref:Nuclease SbcCD subunit D n=1 Tax=Lacticaseibacillus camelliae DSM 22697 = JCM 13995 TaxID=1423730 RepID=A0A0R2F232_9LACO|nr:DNA repair exonuclease [Lacticaseibacillus camelliae DSM 22697 = JCM 13995]